MPRLQTVHAQLRAESLGGRRLSGRRSPREKEQPNALSCGNLIGNPSEGLGLPRLTDTDKLIKSTGRDNPVQLFNRHAHIPDGTKPPWRLGRGKTFAARRV